MRSFLFLIAAALLPNCVFALDSEQLPIQKKAAVSIQCAGLSTTVRTIKGSDVNFIRVTRVSSGNVIKYEVYFYDSLIMACDGLSIE